MLRSNHGRSRRGTRVLTYRLGALADTAGTLGSEVKRHRQGGLPPRSSSVMKIRKLATTYARRPSGPRLPGAAWGDAGGNLRDRGKSRGIQDTHAAVHWPTRSSARSIWTSTPPRQRPGSTLTKWRRPARSKQEADLLEQIITLSHKGGAGALGTGGHARRTTAGAGPSVAHRSCSAGRAPNAPNVAQWW